MKIILLALRALTRFRLYALINILGLALSLACVIIIGRYAYSELTTDHFISKLDRLYFTTTQYQTDLRTRFNTGERGLEQAGDQNIMKDPAVEKFTYIYPYKNDRITCDNRAYDVDMFVVDSVFFQLLDYPIKGGDAMSIFRQPDAAVITPIYARKLFGKEDPIGKTIQLSTGKQATIAGILGEIPTQSSLQFDLLVSSELDNFWSRVPMLLTLLHPGADIKAINAKYDFFQSRYDWDRFIRYQFVPMKGIYFSSLSEGNYLFRHGNIRSIQILFIIVFLILVVGMLNYINIYTVLLLKRNREFGMKKVFGAGFRYYTTQLYAENIFLVGVALFLGWLFVELSGGLVRNQLGLQQVNNLSFDCLLSLSLLLLLPLITSCYPLLKYKYSPPIISLKNVHTSAPAIRSRSIFLTIQYIISIVLIVLSMFFAKQLHFMLHADLGYHTEDIIKVQFLRENYSMSDTYEEATAKRNKQREQVAFLEQKMNESPLFTSWTYNGSPHEMGAGILFKKEGGEFEAVASIDCDENFFSIYDIKLLEGRLWDTTKDRSLQYRVIINETAKKLYGITDISEAYLQPESRIWMSSNEPGMDTNPPYQVVGVVKDFKVGHLSQATPPVLFTYDDAYPFRKLTASIVPGKRAEAIHFMQQLHEEVIGGDFSYSFVEDEIKILYEEDKKTAIIFTVFALIAIFISVMGLFGLSLFDVQQRYKEIAIRKVNGATTSVIMRSLLEKYLYLLLISFVVAAPVSWFVIHKYLEGFAHKTVISWWLFAVALLITGGIALLTLVWQIRKAAETNPAEAIKTE
ncbi:ABC transporter permease [Parabacteroides sp. OttesenSCG-928-J18]|nr:ABC transporter permease [Parabacteroides sp. OttesenSCG-928-J18]